MMSLGNFIATVIMLLSMAAGILLSFVFNLTKAQMYDAGLLQSPYVNEMTLTLDLQGSLQSGQKINKRVAGFCHHDYETITETGDPDYFNVFAELFPGDSGISLRLEMDVFNIYDCTSGSLYDSVVQAAHFNIDKLQEAGYDVRIWFTEMPQCLGQQLPGFILDAIPGITGLLRPHVMPSRDPVEFQDVIESLVREFTIGRENAGKTPVTLYEGWNEVESPGYFFGTRDQLVDNIMIPMIRAVDAVEAEAGYPLYFASHSVANGGSGFTPELNVEVQNKILARGYDVDWINWHWYGTYPFHNYPPGGLEELFAPIIRNNPFATPKDMYDQVRTMKAKFPGRRLMISEWNAGAGGAEAAYDYKAAAYVAGALIEIHHAGLDDANNFLLKAGDGFLNNNDQLNPTGHALKLFHALGENEIEISGIEAGHRRHDVSAIAAYDDEGITIMASRFFGFGVENGSVTALHFEVNNIGELFNARRLIIQESRIDEGVVTGGGTHDTTYFAFPSNGSLAFDVDLPAHNTVFIRVTADDTEGRTAGRRAGLDQYSVSLFPNPSASSMRLLHDIRERVDMEIFNERGQLMIRRQGIGSSEVIDPMPPGQYLLRLTSGDEVIVRKILFQ